MSNNLYLSDKLTVIALRNLIPHQDIRPITLAHIAAFSGISQRTVSTSLQRLRRRGLLTTIRERVGQPYCYSLGDVPKFVDENILLTLIGGDHGS